MSSGDLHPFRHECVCPVCYHIRLAHDSCCFVTCNVGSHDSYKLHLINLSSKYSGMRDPPSPALTYTETISSTDATTLVSLCLQWPEFKVRLCRFKTTWIFFYLVGMVLFVIGISRLSHHPLHWHGSAVTSLRGNDAFIRPHAFCCEGFSDRSNWFY